MKENKELEIIADEIPDNADEYQKRAERSIVKKFRKEIWTKFTKAVNDYELIQDDDKIAVCVSDDAASMLMAKLFQEIQKHGKKKFDVKFLALNVGNSNEVECPQILNNAERLGIPLIFCDSDIIGEENLSKKARELSCNKIAFNNHFDDVIETVLSGMLYGGQIQSIRPKQHSTDFEDIEIIRPLYLIREEDIMAWSDYNGLEFVGISCDKACSENGGISDNNGIIENANDAHRVEIKALIKELKMKNPVVEKNIFRSMENVQLNTVIEYSDKNGRHNFLDTYYDVK